MNYVYEEPAESRVEPASQSPATDNVSAEQDQSPAALEPSHSGKAILLNWVIMLGSIGAIAAGAHWIWG